MNAAYNQDNPIIFDQLGIPKLIKYLAATNISRKKK